MNRIQVGGNLRALRVNRGFSQDYISYKIGISQNSYSKYELGKARMTLEIIFQLANLFEITNEDFVKLLTDDGIALNSRETF